LGSDIREDSTVVEYIKDVIGDFPPDETTGARQTVKDYIDNTKVASGTKYYRASFKESGDDINGV
jgi:hypothetical protein